MNRKNRLEAIRVAAYHGDLETATRLFIEGTGGQRVSMEAYRDALRKGREQRAVGTPCTCLECKAG